jgi:hypothetical protein
MKFLLDKDISTYTDTVEEQFYTFFGLGITYCTICMMLN